MASSSEQSIPSGSTLSSTTTDSTSTINEPATTSQSPSLFSAFPSETISSTINPPSLSTSPLSSPPVATVSSSSPSITSEPSTSLSGNEGQDQATLVSAANVGPIVAGSVSGLILLIILVVFWVRYRANIASFLQRRGQSRTPPPNTSSPPPRSWGGDKNNNVGVPGATTRQSSQGLMSQPFQLATIATGTHSSPHVPPSPSSSHHIAAEKHAGSNQEMTTHADPLGVGLWRSRSSDDDIERGARSSGEGLSGERRTIVGLNDSQTRLIAPPSPPQTPQKAATTPTRHSTPITPTRNDMDLRQSLLSRPLSLQLQLPGRSFSFSRDKKDPPSALRPVIPVEPPTPSSSKSIIPSLPTTITPLGALHPTIATTFPTIANNNNSNSPSPSPYSSIPPTSPDRPSTRESVLSGTSSSGRSGYFSGASIRTADLFYHPYPGAMTPASLGLGTSSRAASILGGMGTPGGALGGSAGGSGGSRPNSSRQGSNGSRPGSRFSALVGSAIGSTMTPRRGSDGTPTPSTRRGSDASGPGGPGSETGHGSSGSERRRSTRNSSNGGGNGNGSGFLPRPTTTSSIEANAFPLSSSPSEFGLLSSMSGNGSPGSGHAWSLKSRVNNGGAFSPPQHFDTLPTNPGDPSRPGLRHSHSDSRLLSSPPSSFIPIPPHQHQLSASDLLDPSYLSSPTSTMIAGGGSASTVNVCATVRPDPIVEEDPTVLHSANPLLLEGKDGAERWRRSSDESYIDFTDDREEDGVGDGGLSRR